MRDFLNLQEYNIVKAMLPLAWVFDCNHAAGTFGQFWSLPEKVRDAIYRYQPLEDPLRVNRVATIDRFEIYEDETGSGLLMLAFSHDQKSEHIECMGQYLAFTGVFVRQPHAVSMKMLEKMQAMSTAKGSLKKLIDATDKQVLSIGIIFMFFSAYILLTGPPLPWDHSTKDNIALLTGSFAVMVLMAVGPVALIGSLVGGWLSFRKDRAQLRQKLDQYFDSLPQHAKHA